jgi:hypothetical protein
VVPGLSSYCLSKLVAAQLVQFIAAKHANVTSVAVSPGTGDDRHDDAGSRRFTKDTPAFVSWSVDELMHCKDEIV